MRIMKGAIPFAVTLAIVAAVTAMLLYFKLAGIGPHHPVFFYLLPIALVAILLWQSAGYHVRDRRGSLRRVFLYDPIYSFRSPIRWNIGDLICFAVLALMAVKCTFELLRPAEKLPAARARFGRP